jgi:hypothetical protein
MPQPLCFFLRKLAAYSVESSKVTSIHTSDRTIGSSKPRSDNRGGLGFALVVFHWSAVTPGMVSNADLKEQAMCADPAKLGGWR